MSQSPVLSVVKSCHPMIVLFIAARGQIHFPRNKSTKFDLGQAALLTRLKMPVKVTAKVETSHAT